MYDYNKINDEKIEEIKKAVSENNLKKLNELASEDETGNIYY